MDKSVIFAVAGSGKTSHIVENLSLDKNSLIITYTTGNFNNLKRKILEKFNKGHSLLNFSNILRFKLLKFPVV